MREARSLLDSIHQAFDQAGFRMDTDKTEVAWIFAGPRPSLVSRTKASSWKLKWRNPDGPTVTRRFVIKAKPVRWLGFFIDKLTTTIGRAVAGTFSTAKGEDAVRAADIPPAKPALDRRREKLLASALEAPVGTPKRLLLPPPATDDSSRHRVPTWFRGASEQLIREGQLVERSRPRPWDRMPWSNRRATEPACCTSGLMAPSKDQPAMAGSSPPR